MRAFPRDAFYKGDAWEKSGPKQEVSGATFAPYETNVVHKKEEVRVIATGLPYLLAGEEPKIRNETLDRHTVPV